MTEHEQKLLVATRVMGWQWGIKQTSHNYWTRTLLPQIQISEYTPIWDGVRDCDSVDVSHLDYFNPVTEPSDALLVKSCMEGAHEFNCDIVYHTSWRRPWLVTFQWHSFIVDGAGQTMQEAIVKAVLRDSIKEILEQMWV